MSKQRPDPHKLANELAGASAFFRRPTPEPSTTDQPAPAVPRDRKNEPPPASEPATSPAAPESQLGRPVRRIKIRHPFEIYADQLDRLRVLAEHQKHQGEPGSMSKIVREAIDRLLDEQLP